MYAIIEDSGKQFKVSEGDKIRVDLRETPEDQQQIEFDRVLLTSDESGVSVGTPLVKGAKVVAKVDEPVKGEKLRIVKYRRRKNSSTCTGHRQKYLAVTIDQILSPASKG